MAVTITFSRRELSAFERSFGQALRKLNSPDFTRRVARYVSSALRRSMRANMVRAIESRTVRRSGTLRNSPKVNVFTSRRGVRASTTFPATAYQSPRRRRPGQYAFIVNHSRAFIEQALLYTYRDPRLDQAFKRAARRALVEILRESGL